MSIAAMPALRWPNELLAGSVTALVTLALLLSLGVLAFSPLGLDAAPVGAAAAFTASALSALIYAVGAPSRLPTGAPTAPTSLMVASLTAALLLDPAIRADPAAHVSWLVAAVAATVVVMALVQLAIALLGWVQLVRKVPQTVLAGFMNAIAVLVLFAQFRPLLGVSSSELARDASAALSRVSIGSLLFGLGTAALVLALARYRPRWPAALTALVAGTLLYQIVVHAMPAVDLGPAVGAIALHLPIVDAWAALRDDACRDFLLRHAALIAGTGAAMAVVAMLESILVVLALDQQFGERTDTRRELAWLGAGNLVGGLCGAVPMGTVRSRAAALINAGGTSRAAATMVCIGSALIFLVGSPLLQWLPGAVLAGIMLTVAWALVDGWTRGLVRKLVAGERSPDLGLSLGVVALVLVTTVWLGPLVGVGIGIVVAAALFIRQLSRSLLRSRYDAARRPSRRVYPAAVEARLGPLRAGITVFELEGALFFGNAEQVQRAAEALPATCRVLVLDLRRVTTADDTGAHLLSQLAPRLRRRDMRLLLAGVQPHEPLGRRLELFGVVNQDWFIDADRAVEAAEQHLLADEPARESATRPIAANTLLAGLDDADVERVRAHLAPLTLLEGERVFRQGDPAAAMYLVARGSISIVAPRSDGRPGPRYATLSSGTLFGEAAMLDGAGRTADAIADTATELYRLDRAALAEIERVDPALAMRLYRNIARYLAQRLRIASAAWAASAQ